MVRRFLGCTWVRGGRPSGPGRLAGKAAAAGRQVAVRVALCAALGWTTGCAPLPPQPDAPAPVTPAAGARAGTPLLTPWMTLTGAWRAPAAVAQPLPMPMPMPFPAPPSNQRLNFQLPVGVALRGELMLIADAGWRQLFRLERSRDVMVPLGPFATALAADHATSLQLGSDGSVWLVEPAAGQVVQLDAAGRVRRTLRDARFASRPIAVVASEAPGDIFVADSTDARIVVFEPFGRVIRRFGEGQLQSIAAMVAGPLGLYVVDRLAQQVVVFGPDGTVRQSFGDGVLVQPRAIAVDAAGRVFVADDADQTIRVFLDGEHIANAGGRGSAPGRFGRIDAMAVDGNLLAVADGVNSRVQLLLVSPESLRRPEGTRP